MKKAVIGKNHLKQDRKKLVEILIKSKMLNPAQNSGYFNFDYYIEHHAKNISFLVATVEYTLNGKKYRINRETGESLDVRQARDVEVMAMAQKNRQYGS